MLKSDTDKKCHKTLEVKQLLKSERKRETKSLSPFSSRFKLEVYLTMKLLMKWEKYLSHSVEIEMHESTKEWDEKGEA